MGKMEDILEEIALLLCRRKVIPTFIVKELAQNNKKRMGEYSNSAYKAFLRCLFNSYQIEYIHDSYGGNIKVLINFLNQSRVMTGYTYEEDTAYVIERFVKPGDVVLDVGANVGAIALILAKKVAPSGKVYAFEPGLNNFSFLWKNLNLNPELKKVTLPINLGLSDCKGELSYVEDSRNRGNGTLVNIDDKNYWSTSFLENYGLKETIETVSLTTIDSFFDEYPISRLDFIKIDVEGMEYNVIKGGGDIIKKFRPIIQYETVNVRNLEEMHGKPVYLLIENFLKDLSYSLYQIQDNTIVQTSYPDYSKNTLAIPSSVR